MLPLAPRGPSTHDKLGKNMRSNRIGKRTSLTSIQALKGKWRELISGQPAWGWPAVFEALSLIGR